MLSYCYTRGIAVWSKVESGEASLVHMFHPHLQNAKLAKTELNGTDQN